MNENEKKINEYISKVTKNKKIKLPVKYQILSNKELIEESIKIGLSISIIYQLLRDENKIDCTYQAFARNFKSILQKNFLASETKIEAKNELTSRKKIEPILDPESYKDSII